MTATRSAVRPVQPEHRGIRPSSAAVAAGRGSGLAALGTVIARRQALPCTAMVAVPLAITAMLTVDQWWALVPLGACAWWWAPRSHGWEWVSATLMGILGAGWASVGADSLAMWPDHRGLVFAIWMDVAFALAVISAVGRYRARRAAWAS